MMKQPAPSRTRLLIARLLSKLSCTTLPLVRQHGPASALVSNVQFAMVMCVSGKAQAPDPLVVANLSAVGGDA